MPPTLSLCIPSKGKALWLEYNLTIALSQAQRLHSQVEVVVSDNASDDDTPAILAKLYSQYPTILRYERQSAPLGACENFSKTIQLAQGKFCWLIGNDDVLRPNALAKIISVLAQYPHLEYIHLNYIFFHPEQTPRGTARIQEGNLNAPINPDTRDYCLDKVIDIVTRDHNCFTAIYASIFSRGVALAAHQPICKAKEFTSLETTVPYTLYIIEHLLSKPSYYIGYPCVLASLDLSWKEYLPYYMRHHLPELYKMLLIKGADPLAIVKYLNDLVF